MVGMSRRREVEEGEGERGGVRGGWRRRKMKDEER